MVLLVVAALAVPAWGRQDSAHTRHGEHTAAAQKPSATEFARDMRKLWEDHITWTRLFIVSAVADLPDLQATTDRLLRNQDDIGDAVKPYYGEDAGAQLTALLRAHILGAADLLTAAKAGDGVKVSHSKDAWYANGDDIARFLSAANPKNWSEAEMDSMMHKHLDLTLAEAVAHLEQRFTDDVAAYDQVHDEILQMADILAAGIELQLPQRFSPRAPGRSRSRVLLRRRTVEANAAVAVLRLELGVEIERIELGKETLEHAEVHAAHQFSVRLREMMERAVVQHDHTIPTRLGFEPTLPQHIHDELATRIVSGGGAVLRRGGERASRIARVCARDSSIGLPSPRDRSAASASSLPASS